MVDVPVFVEVLTVAPVPKRVKRLSAKLIAPVNFATNVVPSVVLICTVAFVEEASKVAETKAKELSECETTLLVVAPSFTKTKEPVPSFAPKKVLGVELFCPIKLVV